MMHFRTATMSTAFCALLLTALGMSSTLADTPNQGHDSPGQTQSSVALKASFPTISGTSKLVTKALDATNLKVATADIGKQETVKGTVATVYIPHSNSIVILDMAADYKTAVAITVTAANYTLFPDLTTLKGQTVLVSGKMVDYKGRPQIEMTKLKQIHIIGK